MQTRYFHLTDFKRRENGFQVNPHLKDENQQQTQPTDDAVSGNRTRATLVGGECSHHCLIHDAVREGRAKGNLKDKI